MLAPSTSLTPLFCVAAALHEILSSRVYEKGEGRRRQRGVGAGFGDHSQIAEGIRGTKDSDASCVAGTSNTRALCGRKNADGRTRATNATSNHMGSIAPLILFRE